jgi:hypothetical protein
MVVSKLSGRREAWDSAMYLSVGIPVLCFASAVCGFLEPANVWRWGLVPMLGQALWMFASQELGNLWPLGLVAFGIFAIPLIIAARTGAAFFRQKISS